nr:hypothetical protein Itr_chr14CG09950 [Ipomoea trifida]
MTNLIFLQCPPLMVMEDVWVGMETLGGRKGFERIRGMSSTEGDVLVEAIPLPGILIVVGRPWGISGLVLLDRRVTENLIGLFLRAYLQDTSNSPRRSLRREVDLVLGERGAPEHLHGSPGTSAGFQTIFPHLKDLRGWESAVVLSHGQAIVQL